jgi:hypothetical protein
MFRPEVPIPRQRPELKKLEKRISLQGGYPFAHPLSLEPIEPERDTDQVPAGP